MQYDHCYFNCYYTRCEDQINAFKCVCTPGYTDAQCGTDIDDCSPEPCRNNATCMDGVSARNINSFVLTVVSLCFLTKCVSTV